MMVMHLFNTHIGVEKGQQRRPDPDAPEGSGKTVMVDTWSLVLTDRMTNDQIVYEFTRDVRDELVRILQDGIVIAGPHERLM